MRPIDVPWPLSQHPQYAAALALTPTGCKKGSVLPRHQRSAARAATRHGVAETRGGCDRVESENHLFAEGKPHRSAPIGFPRPSTPARVRDAPAVEIEPCAVFEHPRARLEKLAAKRIDVTLEWLLISHGIRARAVVPLPLAAREEVASLNMDHQRKAASCAHSGGRVRLRGGAAPKYFLLSRDHCPTDPTMGTPSL
eukprot:CAMPEP_0181215704 /NCGR_PEP_ID=MMETSP1096-20121128/26161_1 /TAXON_ID=156174 ORGANISM="Chrysochromulina ericina, Strain CCMP281" /NCGR_SAMPLE_ID=MMETSP1096 /ASSEMBLY_ACC=CAM_ASM_000453 /LENGTH=196 /DNA_ID=CAMNT_0023307589 /DNA_START=628 /DNA_END=1216 /DNA_ORIENTATION=-